MADVTTNFPERIFTWTIENIDMCPDVPDRTICSPEFSIDSLLLTKFYLALYPHYEDEDGVKYASLYLYRLQSDYGPKSVPLQFKISLLDRNLEPSKYSYVYTENLEKGDAAGREDFIERNALLEFIKNEETISIECKYARDDDCGDSYSPLDCNSKDLEQLSHDFEHSFREKIHSDLNLRSSDGISFKAHRAVVRSSCPDLLQKHGSGSNEEIALPLNSSTLDLLLQYLYSGKMIVENENSIEYNLLQQYAPVHLQQLLFPTMSASACVTRIRVKSGLLAWVVPKFGTFTEKLKLKKTFQLDEALECTKIVISLDIDPEKGYLRFSIWTVLYEEPIHMSCKIYIFDPKNAADYNYDLAKGNVWVIRYPIDIKSLEEKLHLNDDILTVFLQIRVSDGRFMSEVKCTHTLEVTKDQRVSNLWTLQEDFKNLYENSEDSDVTLWVENKEIRAHKMILSARSPVFSKMFQHNMLEEQTGKVVMKDIKEPVLRAMLSYLYCAEVNLEQDDFEFVFDLYAAADRYEILRLRKKCVAYISHKMDSENVGSMLKLADMHNDLSLKVLVTNYVSYHAKKILNSNEFKKAVKGNSISDREMQNIFLATRELGSTIVVTMLSCIYCGELDRDQKCLDSTITLYKNSCKYRLQYLQKQCILHFSKIICPGNIGKLMELADLNKDETLKVCVDNFVTSNLKGIVNSDEWRRIMQEKDYLAADMKNAALAIEDIEVSTMVNLLTLMYRGKLDRKRVSPCSLVNLYMSANKYKLDTLKRACTRYLELEITNESIGKIFVLSHTFKDKALRKSVETYVSANIDKILKSFTWKKKFLEKWDLSGTAQSSFAEAVKELGPTVMMVVLFALCFGKFEAKEHDLDAVTKLYEIGHRYEVVKLKEKCISFFDQVVSESNFSKLLQLLHSCDDEGLGQWAKNFVSSHLSIILESPECRRLMEENLDLVDDMKKIARVGNLEPEILVTALSYLYTGKLGVEKDIGSVINFYKKAEVYKLFCLKKECISVFEMEMNGSNVGQLLRLSDAHKDECLKKCVFNYVCSNAGEFLKSDEFLNLKTENSSVIPDLLTAALLALAESKK